MAETSTPRTCRSILTSGARAYSECGKPAKGRTHPGNTPVCGRHLRAAEANGEETSAL